MPEEEMALIHMTGSSRNMLLDKSEKGDGIITSCSSQNITTLALRYAFGINASFRDNIGIVIAEDLSSANNDRMLEYIVFSISQQIATYHVEDGIMHFFKGKPRNVCSIVSMSIAPNKRTVAVCEMTDSGISQLGIYSVASCKRVRTLTQSTKGNFNCCEFSGNSKFIAAVGGNDEMQLFVWDWGKGLLVRSWKVGNSEKEEKITRIHFHPDDDTKITTSGPQHLHVWYVTAEGVPKSTSILQSGQETDTFVDHIWLCSEAKGTNSNSSTKMVTVTDGESSCSDEASIIIYDTMTAYPFLELKQVIQLRLQMPSRLESLVPFSKGFLVGGGNAMHGNVYVYELSTERRNTFVLSKTVNSNSSAFVSLAVSTASDSLIALTQGGKLLVCPLRTLEEVASDLEAQFVSLIPGDYHHGSILGADISICKPFIVTIGDDRHARVWNYMNWKCQIVHDFVDCPQSVAIDPAGYSLAVGFKEKIKIFHILSSTINLNCELDAKNVRALQFSHGGHVLAAATGFTISIYATTTWSLVHTFVGHIAPVQTLTWGAEDCEIFSTGSDGNVYSWELKSSIKGSDAGRLDDCLPLCRRRPYSSIAVIFPNKKDPVNTVIVTSPNDNYMRELVWNANTDSSLSTEGKDVHSEIRDIPLNLSNEAEKNSYGITSLVVAHTKKVLFCGMGSGSVRAYSLSSTNESTMSNIAAKDYFEIKVHDEAVTTLKLSPDERFLFSFGMDGVVFVMVVLQKGFGVDERNWGPAAAIWNADSKNFNMEAVLVGQTELDEKSAQMYELKKTLEEVRSGSEYNAHRRDAEWTEVLQSAQHEHDILIEEKDALYSALQEKFDAYVKSHSQMYQDEKSGHEQVIHKIENKYEHQLAVELDRYDKLCEDFEAFRQKYEHLFEQQEAHYQHDLNNCKEIGQKVEADLKQQIALLRDEKERSEQVFKATLDQQEEEYEKELQQMMLTAGKEINVERDNFNKMQQILEARRSYEEQLRKRVSESKRNSAAREVLHVLERTRRNKLQECIRKLEIQVAERDGALVQNEKVIQDLQSKNESLDHFRFVLDKRLKEVMDERGPLSRQVEDLEDEVKAMHEELAEEFKDKKGVSLILQQRDLKATGLSQEIVRLRDSLRISKRVNTRLMEDISRLAHIHSLKSLNSAVRVLHQKLQKDEEYFSISSNLKKYKDSIHIDGTNVQKENYSDASESEKEALKQRLYLEHRQDELEDKLLQTQKTAVQRERKKIVENTALLAECHMLRQECILLRSESSMSTNRSVCAPVIKQSQEYLFQNRTIASNNKTIRTSFNPILKSSASTPSNVFKTKISKGSTRDVHSRAEYAHKKQMDEQILDEKDSEINFLRIELKRLQALLFDK